MDRAPRPPSVCDGDATTILSPQASPPGSTVVATLEGVSRELELKVKNCKRDGELFRIDGRLRNAPKEVRDRLVGG